MKCIIGITDDIIMAFIDSNFKQLKWRGVEENLIATPNNMTALITKEMVSIKK